MASFIDSVIEQAKADRKTIVLPEGTDDRVLEAAQNVLAQGIANVVIVGNEDAIAHTPYALDGATIVDNKTSDKRAAYAQAFYELRKEKGVSEEDADAMMDNALYYATMMVKLGDADGMVAGSLHATSDVLRPALQILKTAPGVNSVSSFFVMIVPDCTYGENGLFIFSDCGLEIQPSAEKLAEIAVNSAKSWRALIGTEPRVALLSHSTYGSAPDTSDRLKVVEALKIVQRDQPDLLVDGEMQLDAAIVESVGQSKAPGSPVAGRANVLVFPDLDAGNIGYKLVQRLAKAEAYGPITQGLAAPVNDLSRGCSPEDIVGVVAFTCLQCQAS